MQKLNTISLREMLRSEEPMYIINKIVNVVCWSRAYSVYEIRKCRILDHVYGNIMVFLLRSVMG